MDGDRKYRQSGYQSGYQDSERGSGSFRADRPRPQGPKLPLDVTGPKLPRLVQNVVASRCFNCATTLPGDADFKGKCPKCSAALHCCKQCVHFDSSTRFQCNKPIPVRIAVKDGANECTLFAPIITVARDGVQQTHGGGYGYGNGGGNGHSPSGRAIDTGAPAPRNATDARAAFDSLFKK
jgi:hypothetical protein